MVKEYIKQTIPILAMLQMMLASCQHSGKVSEQVDLSADSVDDDFMTQADMNMASGNQCVNFNDSIENVYQMTVSALPQYEDELNQEKTVWEEYQKAVREVSGFGNHGSSSPMYCNDVINLGIKLREASIHNLWLHLQGQSVTFSKTKFTDAMIDDAYAAFIEAANQFNEFEQDELTAFQESIHKEQSCWKEWMACRNAISQKLPKDIRMVYDDCTNQVKRTKLIQLKNQNRNLGVISGEIMKCALSEDCSDEELLTYPGFDKVWEKYLNE